MHPILHAPRADSFLSPLCPSWYTTAYIWVRSCEMEIRYILRQGKFLKERNLGINLYSPFHQ